MGLDIYVGSLARYYSGRWELMAERWSRENNTPIQVLNRQPIKSLQKAAWDICGWQAALEQQLGDGFAADWDEAFSTPYATHKLDRLGLLGVRLLAWSHLTQQTLPKRVPKDGIALGDLPSLKQSRYSLLFTEATLFLPGMPVEVVSGEDTCGHQGPLASLDRLASQLSDLNARTLNASIPVLEPGPLLRNVFFQQKIPPARTLYDAVPRVEWFDDPESTRDITVYGMKVFSCLANYALKQQLPLVLDS